MSEYADKSKRKHIPSRRRKFLLWVVLPIVALIVSFIALSPQIDAWLATDPFTPQCHFEEDRWFVAGFPNVFASLNIGQIGDDIPPHINRSPYLKSQWSPDGNYVVYAKDIAGHIIAFSTFDGSEIFTLHEPNNDERGLWTWSPNSRYVVYNSDPGNTSKSTIHLFEVSGKTVTEIEFADSRSVNLTANIFYYNHGSGIVADWGWSPDSQYLLLYKDNRIVLVNVESKTVQQLEMEFTSLSAPVWYSATSFYFEESKELKTYDVLTDEIRTVFTHRYNPITAMGVFGENIVGLWDFDSDVMLYNLQTDQLISSGWKVLDWIPDMEVIIIGQDNGPGMEGILGIDMNSGDTLFRLPDGNLTTSSFSSSGQYLLYWELFKDNGDYRRIYYLYSFGDKAERHLLTEEYLTLAWWFNHLEQDWLLVQEEKPDYPENLLMTYVVDPTTFERCKVGLTPRFDKFQPEGQN